MLTRSMCEAACLSPSITKAGCGTKHILQIDPVQGVQCGTPVVCVFVRDVVFKAQIVYQIPVSTAVQQDLDV